MISDSLQKHVVKIVSKEFEIEIKFGGVFSKINQRIPVSAEQKLADATDEKTGRTLIKRVRTELLEKARSLLEQIIIDITGKRVKSLHTDISTVTGERVIIFTLESPVLFNSEEKL